MSNESKAVAVVRVVRFDCGCISEYPLLGEFSGREDWHIIPCNSCSGPKREQGTLERRAEEAWQTVTGEGVCLPRMD